MENKINRNLINMVRSYLTISNEKVDKNKKLLIYGFNFLNNEIPIQSIKSYIFSYCLFCDQATYQITYDHYQLNKVLNWRIIDKFLPCECCYLVCMSKFVMTEQIKELD